MRTERDAVSRLFYLARQIDTHRKDNGYYEGSFFCLLWVLELEERFRKGLLPDTIVRSATGKTTKRSNYVRTLDKLFNEELKK